MWLAVFYIWGSLLAFSVCDICPETSEDASWVKLNPLGHCGDEENVCPYQLTLPPLSIQLPRSFMELDKMAKELHNLKEVVNQLRKDCQECKDRHTIERGEWKDHSEEEEKRPQSLRHNFSIKETQSQSGEQVVRIFTSTLPQRDTSEGEGNVKGGVKRLDQSILVSQRRNIDQRIDLNQGTTDQRSEMSREVKIFNLSLDDTAEDIPEVKLVASPTPEERELKPKQSELMEPSLPRKKDVVQFPTHGKLQPNSHRYGHVKNISSILAARRRVQNVPDQNRLGSISRDANAKRMDLSASAGNRRVVTFPVGHGQLRPKGSYINSRVVKANNEDRLKNPALVRKTNPQAGDMTVKTEQEGTGFSPVRSGVMRVKETSSHAANKKPGVISGLIPSTDDQNKQDIGRVSGPRTDDGHALKNASQVTILIEDDLRKVNKTEIGRLPKKHSKENQGDLSLIATNKSISSVINQAEQPNIFKEEKQYAGLSESLVVISREAETSSKVDREDLPFRGRQVENEKYPNPNTETNNGQIDSTILDKADITLNERTVNPLSGDLKDKMRPGTFIEAAKEDIAIDSQSAGTVKEDIPRHRKAILLEKDLVKSNLVPTVKSKLIDSTANLPGTVQSPVIGQGTRRISITPLKAKVEEEPAKNSENISKIHEVSPDNTRYVMPNLLRQPEIHPRTVISPRGPKLRQPNIINKLSGNRTIRVPSKMSIPVRGSKIARKNGTGIIKQSYMRKPISQTETNINQGLKTKVSTVTQFFGPTATTSTVEQEQKEEIKHIPQVTRSNVLDNHWLKYNITESKSQSEIQNAGDVQDLDMVQEDKYQIGDNGETVLISNIGGHAEDSKTQSGVSNSPIDGKESKIFSLGTTDTSSQHQSEVEKTSSGNKRPTASTLQREKPGPTQFTTSTLSFTDTDHKDGTKNIRRVTNIQGEMAKNVSQDTPISFENIGATRELELTKFNKDRLEENTGEILSNPNSEDMDHGYSEGRYTIPVVLETLTNVEEIKGSKLFSLSPEDTAMGFKSHAVTDEVTEREQVEKKINSTCLSDCNTTPSPKSTTQTRPPLNSEREKGPAQDCADYITKSQRNSVYRVTPRPKNSTFPVFCDMETSGGGWTLIQQRFDGSTSFNRTWDEYKNGFGKLIGEFWLGNDKIHLLTKAKNMSLRIELEDVEGVREYAHYEHFHVANESQQYRLSIGGYSGTAGNAMQFSNKFNHDQKLFTTPDRDNDQYPSGNCGAYYSSGWWFDSCMSANLNGKYYQSKYKGVRNGIFWGTWHNITMEYYPTNERQSFKTVRMMIRPKHYAN
ncbi:uncharacterized protein fgl2b [Pimephales promelas]|uniref:uncharacterized protein fgl2b n=1 Tax=Pimephales promelas TaxID=90988 RepID=UPI001955715C|nr:uncharacterized protein fgl2b [Pimephales promelas]